MTEKRTTTMTASAVATRYGWKPVIRHDNGFRVRTERVGQKYALTEDKRDTVIAKGAPNKPSREEAVAYAQKIIDARVAHRARYIQRMKDRGYYDRLKQQGLIE